MHKSNKPIRIYNTVEQWMQAALNKPGSQDACTYFSLEEGTLHTSPKSVYHTICRQFADEQYRVCPPASLTMLHNGRCLGRYGTAITASNDLIFELSYEYFVENGHHSIFDIEKVPPLHKYYGNAAVLTFSMAHGYYHWMFDVLARLRLLELSGVRYDKIVLNVDQSLPFQAETLQLMNIGQEKIIYAGPHTHIEARALLIPSLTGYTGRPPKWACQYLREALLPYGTPYGGHERIYISRKHAQHRHVGNEGEVEALLKRFAFQTVYLEDMSLQEQIGLFSKARFIVAPHGAGLANLLFAPEGAKVLEFFAPSYVNVVYWVLCNHLNLEYYYLLGEGDRSVTYADGSNRGENLIMNISELEATLLQAEL
ncbi:glycosyltransferase family 61 protein [Ectobacillus ponti]|uniref:Glycosyltransferase family 61 protein n=1 Tax=Ectobacillus ponti TaxID=2961894 RepID=A0AA42BQD9_9BACI|nr:glycosyltransferase family 61 protein [Ectobacillus ponti]MCP8968349.1 glycosyltransferase family 61 protein [Ectobacillus ponti]